MKILLVSACIAAIFGISSIASAQDQYPPQAPGQDQYAPPPPPDQYPPPAQGQYQYPPPAQYAYPPPAQYGYPAVDAYGEPLAPAGAAWVGPPGECLYSYAARMVYWCAPGVVFPGFPVGWDFFRYPVVSFAPGIIVDPDWYGVWRRDHPRFVFRGRIASFEERRDFLGRREEIRNRFRDLQRERRFDERRDERRPEQRRDERRDR